MANIQIPNLPAAPSLSGTEQLEAVQSGSSVRITVDQITGLVIADVDSAAAAAAASASAAATSAASALDSENQALIYETAAGVSASAAAASAVDAAASAASVAGDAAAASASADAAALSASAAHGSEVAAASSESSAAISESNAAASALAASGSASDAAASALAASDSEVAAAASELAAAGSASDAAASEIAAAGSASDASASEIAAAASALAASGSASAASGSEVAAAASALAASGSASAASASEVAAAASALDASGSASAASASEIAAAASALAASGSESAAAASALAASNSETAAAGSASAASDSEIAAAASALAASGSASAASASEVAAAASALAASGSASAAALSETAAAGSAVDAAGSASAAAASFVDFDDRYLGAKAVDPTVDNYGNPLIVGALYFNTTDDIMKVWDGASWLAAYASLSGALIAANNLSDVVSASASRTNLGLGTAATTDATAYATAAQGSLADSAVQPADLATVATTGAYGDLSGLPTLGTAAATDATAYATAAQGSLADSAVQPADLATVATTGAYGDLSGLPTLGTAAATDATAYATAAQGSLASTAIQPSAIGVTVQGYTAVLQNTTASFTSALNTKLDGIEAGATVDQTPTELLTAIKTVDGAGSGLDADLLDGQQGSYYYPASNPSGYTTNTGTVTSVATGGGLTGGTITGSGTISHADTSAQASVNNSGATVIQDVTLDTYGHVTALGSATLTAATLGALSTTGDGSGLSGVEVLVETWEPTAVNSKEFAFTSSLYSELRLVIAGVRGSTENQLIIDTMNDATNYTYNAYYRRYWRSNAAPLDYYGGSASNNTVTVGYADPTYYQGYYVNCLASLTMSPDTNFAMLRYTSQYGSSFAYRWDDGVYSVTNDGGGATTINKLRVRWDTGNFAAGIGKIYLYGKRV